MAEMLKVLIKKLFITTLAPHMRSPSGIPGWFARRLMRSANPVSTKFCIQNRMNLEASDVFLELGAGEGAGLIAVMTQEDTTKIPSQIHLVEISDAMRGELERVVREDLPEGSSDKANIDVHSEDCRSMPYLADGSVDKIFAMNVVYFLNPLPAYLEEIHRVLKPGTGEIVWGCKFDKVPQDNEIFANVKEEKIIEMMKDAGFDVTSETIDVAAGVAKQECSAAQDDKPEPAAADESAVNPMVNYIEIRGRKN